MRETDGQMVMGEKYRGYNLQQRQRVKANCKNEIPKGISL